MSEDHNDDPPASPFVYLGTDPTIEERQLAQQLGRHDGDSVPFHMFAKVAMRLHKFAAQAAGFEWFWRRARRHARTSLGALASTVVVIAGFVLHRVATEAAAQEHAVMQEQAEVLYRNGVTRQLESLDRDIRELRAALQRIGINLPPAPGADVTEPWDKYSQSGSGIPGRSLRLDDAARPEVTEFAGLRDASLGALQVGVAKRAAGEGMWVDFLWMGGALAGPQCHADEDGENVAHAAVVHHGGTAAAISAGLR